MTEFNTDQMKTNLVVFGTRPELIKLIPVIYEIRKRNIQKHFLLIHTGQHLELTAFLLKKFNIHPEVILSTASENQPVTILLSKILNELQLFISALQKNISINKIIIQGDTASTYSGALTAFLNHIPYVHIEAGLRTNNLSAPFPEEYFRKLISLSAEMHFAPTARAKNNLLKEGIDEKKILVTGNTIVDVKNLNDLTPRGCNGIKNKILITCHRGENLNGNFDSLVESVRKLAHENKELKFVWISHFNPVVKEKLNNFSFESTSNIEVLAPVNLDEFYELYQQTKLIITDSGGIQEEAVSFKIPVLVIRNITERTESIDSGFSKTVKTSYKELKSEFDLFLHKEIISAVNPYGDGRAAERIVDYLQKDFE